MLKDKKMTNINSKDMRSIIRKAYIKNENVANDDALLISEVWKAYGWDNSSSLLKNLRNMPSPETITRTRRKLVSEGLITPSMDATERRYKSFKSVRKVLGYGN